MSWQPRCASRIRNGSRSSATRMSAGATITICACLPSAPQPSPASCDRREQLLRWSPSPRGKQNPCSLLIGPASPNKTFGLSIEESNGSATESKQQTAMRSRGSAFVALTSTAILAAGLMLAPAASAQPAPFLGAAGNGVVRALEVPSANGGSRINVSGPVGAELIKVFVSSEPIKIIPESQLVGSGAFRSLAGGVSDLVRNLEVSAGGPAGGQSNFAISNV